MPAPTKPASKKATYHKPPKFTPAEYTVLLKAMDDTAWIPAENYEVFKAAFAKLGLYVSTLP